MLYMESMGIPWWFDRLKSSPKTDQVYHGSNVIKPGMWVYVLPQVLPGGFLAGIEATVYGSVMFSVASAALILALGICPTNE